MTAMVLRGRDGEALHFDGEWLDKLPHREGYQRGHISDFREHRCELKKAKRRKPAYYAITIAFRMIYSLYCEADQKQEIDDFLAAIDAAAAANRAS
jgi:hypothetical protein